MKWFRVTMNRRELLDDGYPHVDLCEVDDEKVVRRIQVWEDGTSVKQTIEGASELRVRKGVRETVPELSWNEPDGWVLVEEITREEFERAWPQAELVGESWG